MSDSPASITAATGAITEDLRQVAVMKKANDVQKDTAAAMVDLIKQASPPMSDHVGTRLNVLA